MSDEALNIWIFATIFLVVWVARLKWKNRKLRAQLAEQAAAPAVAAPATVPAESSEMVRLRERVAVLERITVDKEHTLAREIENLRDH